MRLDSDIMNTRLRALADSDWEDCVPLRWAAQFALGAIPGLLVVLAIMHLAESSSPEKRQHGVSAASMIPLLSASALADHPTFHRLAPTRSVALREAQFRIPDAEAPVLTARRVLTVTKRSSPLPVNFKAPRQIWTKLDGDTRQQIDAGRPAAQNWQKVMLHGSGSARGSARLLDRYQTVVKGKADGAGYHFVIGNGQGSHDGRIEVTDRWLKAGTAGAHAGNDSQISVCLVGDFQRQPPSQAQLEALDELLDYLGLKLGVIPVSAHCSLPGEAGAEAADKDSSHCLGPKFPAEQILKAAGTAAMNGLEASSDP